MSDEVIEILTLCAICRRIRVIRPLTPWCATCTAEVTRGWPDEEPTQKDLPVPP